MNKARKRFVLFAMVCVFVLLAVLLGIINGVNFTMASEDADRVTQMLADQSGRFAQNASLPEDRSFTMRNGRPENRGPMGPDSPEMAPSLRYFTYAFDADGNSENIAWEISSLSQEDALAWANSLLGEKNTGWTGVTYRYRVYAVGGRTFVTVIDQGRELLGAYRILRISLIGLAAGLLVSCAALLFIGKRLFQPLEEADRKQKRFIAEAEKEFKIPLTIINANTEIMERESGETEQTLSINRQVKRMITLVKRLGALSVFGENESAFLQFDLANLVRAAGDAMKGSFEEKGCALNVLADQAVPMRGDSEAISEMITELLNNALKFCSSWCEIKAALENGHTVLTVSNDTVLPNGSLDQVFDRFTRLENAEGIPGVGLGLSHVKEIVQAHNGRASAKAANGEFILRITL